jgi:hypothetical protein
LSVRRLAGALLLLVAAIGVAIGGLWALMKANDAEVDICSGSECTSGWYYAVRAPSCWVRSASHCYGASGTAPVRASA